MTKEDLNIYTKEELELLLVNLINDMEKKGKEYMDEYKTNKNSDNIYVDASILLTFVNRTKTIVGLKNFIETNNSKNLH